MGGTSKRSALILDQLDKRIVAALQVNGRASWQQVARAVGGSESTVARRAQRLLQAGALRIVAIADPARCGFGYPVLVQLKCEAESTPELARTLAMRPDVRFLALVTGSFDIVMELIVPSRRYLARVLIEEVGVLNGVQDTTTETVLRNFKMSYDWSRQLLGDRAGELEGSRSQEEVGSRKLTPLDDLDLSLLELLIEDGRKSFSDLSSALGITESMARRRVDAMHSKGCIRFGTLIEPHLLGFDVEVLCWLRVDLSQLEPTARALIEPPEVRYVSATIGYSDLLCEMVFASQEAVYDFSTTTLGALRGIRWAEFGLELQTVKRAHLEMPSARFDLPEGPLPLQRGPQAFDRGQVEPHERSEARRSRTIERKYPDHDVNVRAS